MFHRTRSQKDRAILTVPEKLKAAQLWENLTPSELIEHALRRREGVLGRDGQFIVDTRPHTGRSPKDKAFVKEPASDAHIDWGDTNRPTDEATFNALFARVEAYFADREAYSLDCFVGADERYRVPVRVYSEFAWHSLFARHLFITPSMPAANFEPEFTVIDAALFEADPKRDNVPGSTFILVNFARRMILIGGTRYAGEIKKSIFTVMNYLLPLRDTLPMHCSANVGANGDTAIFFGLSGTGKTTLSSDPHRPLIGDDEHGWSNDGVFNFEGGCYAKVIRLSPSAEPEIWAATNRYSTVLENVAYDEATRELDVDSESKTENTRSAYPLEFIPNIVPGSKGGHPRTVIMLTADAFGVLPPISKLSHEQAMYHFLSGYTAKVAGTERGVTEPTATFSTCFGAPFMVHHPTVYAKLLGEKLAEHDVQCWLVNTGWSGGAYGVGKRMSIAHTRAMVNAAIEGRIPAEFEREPFFGLQIPKSVPGVPKDVLDPRAAWADKHAYDAQARKLSQLFFDNFKRFEMHATDSVKAVAIKPKP
ncbi:MAG TPA: phosphoenolpyruvate carboxykinase (ATP) [Candidatus Baltobacteraceae bacterium]|nr:phosphoenolpyruvate carboxykinase (ATP) [Candidatus Baltobacteraceae bacterium]